MGAAENKALVVDYLVRVGHGDPSFAELLDENVSWWVPPGSHVAGEYRGKAAVLEFIRKGAKQYAPGEPIRLEVERIVSDEEWACAQLVIRARTARGREYHNYLHIAFEIRDGRIVRAKEYVDTKQAHDVLVES